MRRWIRTAVVLALAGSIPTGVRFAHAGQLPEDVHPESRSRLPPIDRVDLDAERRAACDAVVRAEGAAGTPMGATALRLHGSGTNLRWAAPMGRQLTELTILTTAREYDQPYEWALHELEALAVGLDARIIDVVRHRSPLTGLSSRDAIIIEVGRELFGTRRLSADTYARALGLLGKTNLVDVIDVMGRYAGTAATLTAFNQRMPAGWRQSLPLPFTHPDDVYPRRPLTGSDEIDEKDAALIAFARELFGDHNVGRETYAQAVRAFGERDLVDLVGVMGSHAADAAVLAAFDQHLPEGRQPLLPLQ